MNKPIDMKALIEQLEGINEGEIFLSDFEISLTTLLKDARKNRPDLLKDIYMIATRTINRQIHPNRPRD